MIEARGPRHEVRKDGRRRTKGFGIATIGKWLKFLRLFTREYTLCSFERTAFEG
jgi:hypothetical protein